jgi:hypothetical protein
LNSGGFFLYERFWLLSLFLLCKFYRYFLT